MIVVRAYFVLWRHNRGAFLRLAGVDFVLCYRNTNPSVRTISIVTLGTLTTIIFNANPLSAMMATTFLAIYSIVQLCGTMARARLPLAPQATVFASQQPIRGHIGLALYGCATTIYRALMLFGLAWVQ